MSIRKVLGASFQNVWLSLSRDFLKPVLIAFLLVTPLAAWLMQTLLSNIAYHKTYAGGCLPLEDYYRY